MNTIKHIKRTTRTFGIPLAIVIPASYWLGIAATKMLGLPTSDAWKMLVIVGAGWVVQLLIGKTVLKEKSWLYTLGIGYTMVLGMAPLVPALLISELTGHQYPVIILIGVLISFSIMLKKQVATVKQYGFAGWLPYSWAASLAITAVLFSYLFYQQLL